MTRLNQIFELEPSPEEIRRDYSISPKNGGETWYYVPSSKSTVIESIHQINAYCKNYSNPVLYEIGCGIGRVALAFAQKTLVKRVVGIDIEEIYINRANREAQRFGLEEETQFICGNALDINIDDADIFYLYEPFTGSIKKAFFNKIKEHFFNRKMQNRSRLWDRPTSPPPKPIMILSQDYRIPEFMLKYFTYETCHYSLHKYVSQPYLEHQSGTFESLTADLL